MHLCNFKVCDVACACTGFELGLQIKSPMHESSTNWDSKIKFLAKLIGFDNEDQQQSPTLDSINSRSQISRRTNKGIKMFHSQSLVQSMMLPTQSTFDLERRWLNMIRSPFRSCSKSELVRLTSEGICFPHKVMPWMAQNKHKINLKLYSIKKVQLQCVLAGGDGHQLEKMNSEIEILRVKEKNSPLLQLLGVFLLYREDMHYGQTLVTLAQTVHDYLYDSPVISFSLLYHLCCNGALSCLLTSDQPAAAKLILTISNRIRTHCSGIAYLIRDFISLPQYVRTMVECFWLNMCESRTSLRQKVLYYLLVHRMEVHAVSKVCEAMVVGLSGVVQQGNRQRIVEVFANPKMYLDEEAVLSYLFSQY